ncbi:MAG: DUF3606 domain-containing protein [Sphingobacteriales bacterium JAD_PAG50586_3]|nr:MAG: DUF3606 domain-containing protein [Sphingobacteriales bacterium JAD_PAG50586_3]
MKANTQVDFSQSKNINIANNAELNFWSKSLGITNETLVMLVHEIGTDVEDVKYYLQRIKLLNVR